MADFVPLRAFVTTRLYSLTAAKRVLQAGRGMEVTPLALTSTSDTDTFPLGRQLHQVIALPFTSRKEKTTPFGVNLMRSQVLYQAAQALHINIISCSTCAHFLQSICHACVAHTMASLTMAAHMYRVVQMLPECSHLHLPATCCNLYPGTHLLALCSKLLLLLLFLL